MWFWNVHEEVEIQVRWKDDADDDAPGAGKELNHLFAPSQKSSVSHMQQTGWCHFHLVSVEIDVENPSISSDSITDIMY